MGRRHGATEAPAVMARLRDAYLEPWTGRGHSPAELRQLAALACRVGAVGRADSWRRVFADARTSADAPGKPPAPTSPAPATPAPATAAPETGEQIAVWLRELLRQPGK